MNKRPTNGWATVQSNLTNECNRLGRKHFASKGEPAFRMASETAYTKRKVILSDSGLKPSPRLLRKGNKAAIALQIKKPYVIKSLAELQFVTERSIKR